MAMRTYKSFYSELCCSLMTRKSLHELLDANTLKDTAMMKWILEKSVKDNNIALVDYLLSRGITFNILNPQNQTAIHIAVSRYNFKMVDLLFSHYGSTVNHMDEKGLSHFHAACITGNSGLVEEFLKNGADANGTLDYMERKQSPLHLAVLFKRLEVVKLLLQYGANPNSLCSLGCSPLHLACCGDTLELSEIIRWIIKDQQTAVWDSFERISDSLQKNFKQEMSMIKLLIKHGCDVNIKNSSGDTAMNSVFEIQHLRTMFKNYPDSALDIDYMQSMIEDLRHRQRTKIDFLRRNGADAGIVNNEGNNIVHIAIKASKGFLRPVHLEGMYFEDNILAEIIRDALKAGADVNIKNKNDLTPLQLAVNVHSFETVQVLLAYNADFTGIRFDRLCYNNHMIPSFQATENIIKIANALERKGLYLNQTSKLNILNFLVQNNFKSPYFFYPDSDGKEWFFKLKNILELGTEFNIKYSLNKFLKNQLTATIRYKTARQIRDHLSILEICNIYASNEIKEFLLHVINSLVPRWTYHVDADLRKELAGLNALWLTEDVSLVDVLSMDPGQCHGLVRNGNYMHFLDCLNFKARFPNTSGIIEGHLSKALVRRYVVETAKDHLAMLIGRQIPDLCCNVILDYLSNESLYNMCAAAVL